MKKVYLPNIYYLYIIYILFTLSISLYSFNKPFYNWDMIPYIAVALSFDDSDSKAVHSKTYETIKKAVPAHIYTGLTHGDYLDYRGQLFKNHQYFTQQLPYYKIRPLYTSLIYIGYKMGFNIVTATIMVSSISGLFIAVLIFFWLSNHVSGYYPFILSFLTVLITGIVEIARLQTPDALSVVFLLTAIYLLFEKERIYWSALLLVLSIFARTDNLIIVLLLTSYLKFLAPIRLRINLTQYALFISLSLTSYLTINHWATDYGWAKVIYHTLVHPLITPNETEIKIDLVTYLQLLWQRGTDTDDIFLTNDSYIFLHFLYFSIITLLLRSYAIESAKAYVSLTVLVLLSILLHYLLFPILFSRFFVAHYVIIVVSMIVTLFGRLIPKVEHN